MAAKQFYRPGRRARIPLSCDPCRTRKLKCNREKPCQNCAARDERTSCRYKGSKNRPTATASSEERGDPMQQRIEYLENLVKKLIDQRQGNLSSNVASSEGRINAETGSLTTVVALEASDVAHSADTTVIEGVHSIYKGADDWYDVLQEINNLKDVWSQTQDDISDYELRPTLSHTVDGSSLLFGNVKQIELSEILATLPPKVETDKLLREFFDRETFPISVAPILHQPTFMREYAEHCRDPSRTNVIWLGLLFSILGIIMLSYHQYNEPPAYAGISESLFQLYRRRTAQCLLIGDIAKCLPYTLETLRLNATAELNRKDDNRRGLWIMTGVIVRAAINMGYHRDPVQYPTVSVLQAEYRRRVWLSVIGMDEMASFMLGFPRMMPAAYSDTTEPRNLHDWELSDNTTVLPPSRPLTETTPATYSIAKGRLFRTLGLISDFYSTPRLGPYDTILELDKALLEVYQNFPPQLKLSLGSEEFNTSDQKAKITKMSLGTMYHRGMCMLHRKFMAKGRLDPRYNLSRDRCISSALAILETQEIIDPSWYTFSQTRQFLTLAAMILFLELEHRRKGPDADTSSDTNTLLYALEKSCALWGAAKHSCDETWRVHRILAGMLSSFQPGSGTSSSRTETPEPLLEFPGLSPRFQPVDGGFSFEKDLFAISSEMNIDWATWDAFIETTNF